MFRFHFIFSKPYIDAESAEAALKAALANKTLVLQQSEIPKPTRLLCSVTPTPNSAGVYSARAIEEKTGQLIATADAPSPDRALRALGLNNPEAHTCKIYKQRYGVLYELIAP